MARGPRKRVKAAWTLPTLELRRRYYSARRVLGIEAEKALGLRMPVLVYFKDPLVARQFPGVGIDNAFVTPWEPGLGDGPTSARFAVVDYDGSTDILNPPAKWDPKRNVFLGLDGAELDARVKETFNFRQVSTWAVLQATLDHFEGGFGLGRRIMWGFEGNRLIVVPHAGYGENAFYDRRSKSIQFYYFDNEDGERIFTCSSSDIVNHEFGHALLDGIRPYYLEAVMPQTAAFHEYVGDITAILMVFRNNGFRRGLAARTNGELSGDLLLAGIAQQFGDAVSGQDYLRSASNTLKMADVESDLEPHRMSQVLTGAMFDFLLKVSVSYRDHGRNISVASALWFTVQRLQTMAIQALDLLPPVEVSFEDYILAVLRAEFVVNPTDPQGYRPMLIDVFIDRGLLADDRRQELLTPESVFVRTSLAVEHDLGSISSSRAAAYRFLDDNRVALFIPRHVDLVVADVFTAEKRNGSGQRLPKQIILQYVWREEITLEGPKFGAFAGRSTGMLCGATLVLDGDGNFIHWVRKPGSGRLEGGKESVKAEMASGAARRQTYLSTLARKIAAGMVGEALGGPQGLLADSVPPLAAVSSGGSLRFELAPHLSSGHAHDDGTGGGPWQLSS